MPAQVTNYQCPACTGPLHYAEDSGKLKCDYCGSTYEVSEIEALYADKEAEAAAAQAAEEAKGNSEMAWNVAAAGGEWGEDADSMRAYSCPSCGAQILCDATTAATSCPYCGNPTVVPGQFGGTLRPDYVLPFKQDKEAAVKALKAHYKGKILLPKAFKEGNHIEEIKGIYVPFWLFDGDAEADMVFHATNSSSHREGDYIVTNTRHYNVGRSGNIAFEKVSVDGSSKMPDDFMDSIEPFDYQDLKEFSTAYLPGFLADKYDVNAAQAAPRAEERCRNTTKNSVRKTVIGYDTVSVRSESIVLHRGDVKYALMPVWLLNTKWNDQNYLFAMNGQTGKMVGDLPIDKKKKRLWFWGVAIAASAVLTALFSGPFGHLFSSWL